MSYPQKTIPHAKAQVNPPKVRVIVPETVTLTLDSRTAGVLMSVCGRVGGPPEGDRGCIAAILRALEDAGVDQAKIKPDPRYHPNNIYLLEK